MAPESSDIENVDHIDHIDLVALEDQHQEEPKLSSAVESQTVVKEEEKKEDEEQQASLEGPKLISNVESQPHVEEKDGEKVENIAEGNDTPIEGTTLEQQERRLEDVRRVRDEAESLRQEICQLRIRLEEVEEESKFHAAKANELTELLLNSHSVNGNSGIDGTILKQSETLAKRACQIEKLEKKIISLKTEKAMVEIERDDAKKETASLSVVVRSLQNVAKSSVDSDIEEGNEDDVDDDESEDSEEVVLTPETALDLTLGNLKEHIEMLEDGLQASSSLNSDQKKAINTLEKDNELAQAKIEMLEELFRNLNDNDRLLYHSPTPTDKEKKASKKKKKGSDEIGALSIGKEESLARQSITERLGIRMASFTPSVPEIRVPDISFPKMTLNGERKPEIPQEAAAAAQAAAILIAHGENEDSSSPTTPKKKKKTSNMKKVKIRFKKAGLEGTYTGPLVDKKPHGVGTIRFTNGNTYLGEMTRGKMSGTGTLYTKTGVFRGLFENNQFMGEKEEAVPENIGDSLSNPSTEENIAQKFTACDSTTTTVATDEETEEDLAAQENAMAALELDGFSPTTITGTQDVASGIDDSFNLQVDLEGMERKTEYSEIKKEIAREENESFLREFSGSEGSSSTIGGKEDWSSDGDPIGDVL